MRRLHVFENLMISLSCTVVKDFSAVSLRCRLLQKKAGSVLFLLCFPRATRPCFRSYRTGIYVTLIEMRTINEILRRRSEERRPTGFPVFFHQ